jgi:aspartate/methionine/tyrosine aminotransferase
LIIQLKQTGHSVKGFLFCNPSNPLGEVYSLEVAERLMKVCAKFEMHFISDEVYALSVYDKEVAFKSILSLQDVVDPSRTHFMWGMSKDLGIAGFRFGVIHTKNTDLLKVLSGMSIYTGVPAHIQELGAKMLKDKKWLNEIYFPNNISRLRNNYQRLRSFLETKHNLQVRKASAGFFIWVNFAKFLPKKTAEEEMKLFSLLFEKHKLYIIPGTQMASKDPGWFRIVIAIKETQLEEFEKRFDEFASQNCA